MTEEQLKHRIYSFIKEGLSDLLCLDGSAYEDLEEKSSSGTVTEENIKNAIGEELYYYFEGFRADDEARFSSDVELDKEMVMEEVNRFEWTLDDAGLHWHGKSLG